jgi:hypothetical protein
MTPAEPLRGAELVEALRAILNPLRGIPLATAERAALTHTPAMSGRKGAAATNRRSHGPGSRPGRGLGRMERARETKPRVRGLGPHAQRKVDPAEVVRRFLAGETADALAAEHGVTRRCVQRHLARAGLTKDTGKPLLPEAEFRRLHALGGCVAVGEVTGQDLKHVRGRARRLGLETPT